MTVITTTSEEQTEATARQFAVSLRRGDVVALTGDLGTGKTQFVRGVCSAFRISHVSSPTFVMVNRYEGIDATGAELLVYHLDLYRATSPADVWALGYEELLGGNGICLIEWAEVLGDLLPVRRYDVHLEYGRQEHERRITIGTIDGPHRGVSGSPQ